VNKHLELPIEGLGQSDTAIDKAAKAQGEFLSEAQFNELSEKLIRIAAEDGRIPSDALAALAKALGTLSTFTAHREGLCTNDVVAASQASVATFARAAEVYMTLDAERAGAL
jgi:hypothetical protein